MSLSRGLCRSGGWLLLCLGVACSDGGAERPGPEYRLSPERAARLEALRTEILSDTCNQGVEVTRLGYRPREYVAPLTAPSGTSSTSRWWPPGPSERELPRP
ncbi:hypothetical protein [Myxococcus fulvus]|uniref:hypothetical protein n=1 Tax=Myxococcus fulvus TaxID=33 RepID=UPI0020C11CAD|nr:hypothetical protein [Myxococcus fulvus]MCK8496757.1 hypothetical protein [Myxococcus fulvus]